MSDMPVETHLATLSARAPHLHRQIMAMRDMVRAIAPDAFEKVMYGGLLYSAPRAFCGLFAYTAHVSIEFGRGAFLPDPWGFLEGNGKQRRFIRIGDDSDLTAKRIADYIAIAFKDADGRI